MVRQTPANAGTEQSRPESRQVSDVTRTTQDGMRYNESRILQAKKINLGDMAPDTEMVIA